MGIQRFMAAQLRQPSGWFGTFVMSRMLNRVNRQIIDRTLTLLDARAEHSILEIGFGGGSALSRLAKAASSGVITGVITGVDVSPEMILHAERRFRREIQRGHLRVQLGDATHLPFASDSFDRVFTINTIYFWPDVLQGLGEIYRVLRQDGLAAIAVRSKEKMEKHAVTKYDFRLFSADDVAGLMRQTGFREIRIDHRDKDKWYDQVIVVGSR
jgi:ubiquinone/menaquinone biosynthesis C-methylase UbiE